MGPIFCHFPVVLTHVICVFNMQLWSKTQSIGAQDGDISPEGTPPQLITWHAHSDVVVSVEYITRNEHAYVLSASLDQTARLWTTDAQYVSMFGQV